MAANDWYRSTSWTPATSSEFWVRWKRARQASRAQYLRIQAATLMQASLDHDSMTAAVELLDKLLVEFANERIEVGLAWDLRGRAMLALSRADEAIRSFQSAVAHETVMPNVRTDAYLELLFCVATHRRRDLYDEAMSHVARLSPEGKREVFPMQKFQRHAAMAFIPEDLGATDDARRSAELAIAYANADRSGMARHPELGLVGRVPDEVHRSLQRIAKR